MEYSTPDFAFFYLVSLSVIMATLGLLADSVSIVIGSMLMAPVLYPILALSLGVIMSNSEVIVRSTNTLIKALGIGLVLAALTSLLFGGDAQAVGAGVQDGTLRIIASLIEPSVIHVMVGVVAGLGVSFALAQPEWSETLPGIAISVALVPPLAVLGIGISVMNLDIISGSAVLLLMNLLGISFAAIVSFALMNLYEKQHIAESTIKREEEKLEEQQQEMEKVEQEQNHDKDKEQKEA